MGWPQVILFILVAVILFAVLRYVLSLLRVAVGIVWQLVAVLAGIAIIYFVIAAVFGVPQGWPTLPEIRQSIETILHNWGVL